MKDMITKEEKKMLVKLPEDILNRLLNALNNAEIQAKNYELENAELKKTMSWLAYRLSSMHPVCVLKHLKIAQACNKGISGPCSKEQAAKCWVEAASTNTKKDKKSFMPLVEVFSPFKKPFSSNQKQVVSQQAVAASACCACTACTACR